MKKLLFLLLFLPFLGNSQATFTAPVGYNTGAPTATPSGVGTRWRFDLLTGKKYTWLPGSLSWDEDARGIDQVAGCSAPLYTPGYNQSTFAVNSCSPPVLYQWTGAAWEIPNEPEIYTAGTGISIDGSNVITNTSPNVVQTLSIAGQDLTLSGGGGTVAIPAGSSLGTGFTSGGGTGTIPDETVAKTKVFTLISDDDTVYNPTGVFSSLNFGGRYNDETFVFEELPGFASFVSGVPASGTFSQFLFDGATKGMKFQGIGPLDRVNFTIAPGIFSFRYDNTSESYSLNFGGNGVQFRDDRAVVKGLEYRNYYENIENENNSLTSTQNVNSLKQKLVLYTEFERDAISSPVIGYILFCTDATADDSSTGVMQVWDGSTWKNAW